MLTVIGTNVGRSDWWVSAASSIAPKREVTIVIADGFEIGKLKYVYDNFSVDRFLFLQDSFEVKDDRFFDLLNEYPGSVSINKDPYYYGCYAGVYEKKVLREIGFPLVLTKRTAVEEEVRWHKKYIEVAGEVPVLFPDFTDASSTRTVIKNGRENLVIENEYLIKYKGTWRYDQIVD